MSNELTEFEVQLRNQILKNWKNYRIKRIDLAYFREKQQFDIAGKYICVKKFSSSTAAATIILNEKDNDPLDLEEGVEIETLFKHFFISNTAQSGEWIDLIIGADFRYKKKPSSLKYVDRGDLQFADYPTPYWINDQDWHDLDMSYKLPAGTKLVFLRFVCRCLLADCQVFIRQKGYTGFFNAICISTLVDNKTQPFDSYIDPGKDRKLEYIFTSGTWPEFNMSISCYLT